MKLYLVTRNDAVGYDEYDAAVVCAESEDQAVELLKVKHGPVREYNSWGKYYVSVFEIPLIEGIVLESFNAG